MFAVLLVAVDISSAGICHFLNDFFSSPIQPHFKTLFVLILEFQVFCKIFFFFF